ncbi:hypothetical protein HDU76_007084 [Blyttiomyces sp. JEL0837]|nr:hypothetical protein HDU76_007084 [Blyttiomyces sp. JEL0837]
MSPKETTNLDAPLVEKAVKALITVAAKSKEQKTGAKKDLLEDEDVSTIWLVITTKKVPDSARVKPQRIPLKHPIIQPDAEVCLFTKDPQKDYKALMEKHNVKIDKVIGVSKLRENYHPYEAKRQLCSSYNLFLADDRILTLLPPILGNTFFKTKKLPVPVDLTSKNIAKEIESARSATYLHLTKGTCVSVKIGKTNQTATQVKENVLGAINKIVDKIPRKWANILSLQLKTSDSIALPIYNSLPDEEEPAAEVNKSTKKGKAEKEETIEDNEAVEEEDDSMEAKVSAKQNKAAAKQKKAVVAVEPAVKRHATRSTSVIKPSASPSSAPAKAAVAKAKVAAVAKGVKAVATKKNETIVPSEPAEKPAKVVAKKVVANGAAKVTKAAPLKRVSAAGKVTKVKKQ